ncbi:MAG: aldo/keto reductase [Bacteroidota bacterium]
MEYTRLGNSELSVSRIALGCMSMGTDESHSRQIVHAALDAGITFLDTADLYDRGENERLLGKHLKGIRKDVIIATKVGNQWRPDGSGWDWNPRKTYIFQAVEASLKRLQTDYIDVYQLHGGTIDDPTDEAIEAFERLIEKGMIRAYGISSIRPNVIRRWISQSNLSSNMMQYSLLDRRPEEEMLGQLQEAGVGVLVRGALAKGLLVNKPAREYLKHSATEVEKLQSRLKEMSSGKGNTAQLALAWTLAHPAVSSIVCGASTPQQIIDNVQATQLTVQTEERQELMDTIAAHPYELHR